MRRGSRCASHLGVPRISPNFLLLPGWGSPGLRDDPCGQSRSTGVGYLGKVPGQGVKGPRDSGIAPSPRPRSPSGLRARVHAVILFATARLRIHGAEAPRLPPGRPARPKRGWAPSERLASSAPATNSRPARAAGTASPPGRPGQSTRWRAGACARAWRVCKGAGASIQWEWAVSKHAVRLCTSG